MLVGQIIRKMIKKIIVVALVFILTSVPVFADQERLQTSTNAAITYDYPLDILELLAARNNLPSGMIEGELVSVEKSIQRVSASDSNGFKAVMLTILGDYETVITDYEYRNGNSQYNSHSINIERDWSWICSAAVFGLVIFCFFRFIGGLFAR